MPMRGRLSSRNITPDPVAGIGAWTAEQFLRAWRTGIAPSGEHCRPTTDRRPRPPLAVDHPPFPGNAGSDLR
jgi:hypothetical protein